MIGRLAIIFSVFASAFTVPPASAAQYDVDNVTTWPSIGWKVRSNRSTYENLGRFARCLIRDHFTEVRALVAMPVGSPEVATFSRTLVKDGSRCLEAIMLRMKNNTIRSALIEELYRRDYLERSVPAPAISLGPDVGRIETAKCIVRTAPASSDDLLRTPSASKEQERAYQTLAPAFRACAPTLDMATVNPQILRFHIAEALYRARSTSALPGGLTQ